MLDSKDQKVPKPGPAKLSNNAGVDEWLQKALNNQYLPEQVMKKLCEICKEYLMEGMMRELPPRPIGLMLIKK